MSWAAGRRTTRAEDEAYCLMGIFGINMPLLYGEGRKAFRRLQEEIIRVSDDHSILAFETDLCAETSLFAHHPGVFRRGRRIRGALAGGSGSGSGSGKITAPFGMTNAGLSIATPLVHTLSPFWVLAVLNCVEVQGGGGGDGHEDEAAAVVRRAQVCLPLFGKEGKYMRARAPVSLICKVLDDDDGDDNDDGGREERRAAGGRGDQIRDLTTRRDSEYLISYFSRVYSAYGTEMDIALKGFGSDSDQEAPAAAGWLLTFPRGMARYVLHEAWPPRDLRADISFFMPQDTTAAGIAGGLLVFRDGASVPARYVAVYLALEIEGDIKLRHWTCRLVPVPAGFQRGQAEALAELAGLELAAAMRAEDERSDSDDDGDGDDDGNRQDNKGGSADEKGETSKKKQKGKKRAGWRHYHQLDNAIVAARTRFHTLKGEPCSEAVMLELVFDADELMRERDVDILRQVTRVVTERKTF